MADEAQPRSAGRTIARNTFFGIGAQLALRVAGFIYTNILVINTLGSEQFGKYSIVLAWATLFSVIGDLGIAQYLTREIARDREQTGVLFWNTVALRFFLAMVASAITTGGAILAGYETEIVIAIGFYTSTYFFQAVLQPLVSILLGNERIDITSVYWVIWQVLIMILSLVFLFLGLDFLWLVIAQVAVLPIVITLHYLVIRQRRLGPPPFRLNPELWWSIIKGGLPFAFTQLSLSFAFRADTVLLSLYNVSNAEVGWYNIAYNLTLTLLSIVQSFTNAILPTLAREHANNPDSVRPWYYTSVRGMLFFTLPIAVGGMLTAGSITGLLYEPEIMPAAIALAILVWDIPVATYHNFGGNMANSIKREGRAARIYMGLGVINIALNFFLIPRFGIVGSALSTVVTDLTGAALFYTLFRHEFGAGLDFKRIARLGLATVVMGAAIYLLRDLHFFALVPISAAVYLATVWALKAFNDQELSWLVGFVSRRLHLRPAS